MPTQYFRDPATGNPIPLLGSGLSQSQGDARYVQPSQLPKGPSGFRNVIRNGDMSVAQRGDGPWTANASQTVDGWRLWGTGSSVSRVKPDISYSPMLKIITPAADAQIFSYNESVSLLHGTTVTLSFIGYVASGTAQVAIKWGQVFGSGGSPSSAVYGVFDPIVTLTTTPKRFSVNATLPSVSGKVIGTNRDDNISIGFALSGVALVPVQANTFYITDVQLEEGPIATPFERLPYQQQLAWCQRYFQRTLRNPSGHAPWMLGTKYSATGEAYCLIQYPPMRSIPTISFSTAAGFYFLSTATSPMLTNILPGMIGRSAIEVVAQFPGGGAAGDSGWIRGDSNAFIDLSAEL